MTGRTERVLAPGVVALVLTLVSCSSTDSRDSPDATQTAQSMFTTSPSSASATADAEPASPPANAEVSDRARAALTRAGAQQLVLVPGYEREVNTGFDAVWRGESLTAYVVATSALPSADEFRLLSRRQVRGQSVEVVTGQHSTVRMLRFERGRDTWLVTSLNSQKSSDALVQALLS